MRALILDFDGLMVDTEWPAYEAWQAIYARYGAALALTDWVKCVGSHYGERFDPVHHLSALTGRSFDHAAMVAEKNRLKWQVTDTAPLLPGVTERIAEARALGWPVGVGSSSGLGWVQGHLDRLGVSVDAVRTADHVQQVKPHPDIFLALAEALGVPPGACVVCEDSMNGVLAARAAGMYAVAVPNRVTRVLPFEEADLRLDSLTALSLRSLAD